MITVYTKKSLTLKEFNQHPFLQSLKEQRSAIIAELNRDDSHDWTLDDVTVKCLNVLFIGQTGTGKSTLINRITGGEYMLTDDVRCCTKEMGSVDFKLSSKCSLCFCDMPGIGENSIADAQYYEWYRRMFDMSDCVVYLLRAEKRDYALDLEEFQRLREINNKKLILGLGCVDKLPPLNRSQPFRLSSEQKEVLKQKIDDIRKLFKVNKIFPFSATENYKIDKLTEMICEVLLNNLGISWNEKIIEGKICRDGFPSLGNLFKLKVL